MTENKKTDAKDTVKFVNPVSLGVLYFSFSLSLWSSEQISNWFIFGIAILFSLISIAFFVAVFSQYVLSKLSKWVLTLVSLTFSAFIYGFTTGWLQAFSQVSGIVLQVIAYFGFAWIIVILLILVRDTAKQPNNKKNRLSPFTQLIRPYVPYVIIAAFFIIAVIKFLNHDFWSGVYLIVIAGLALSVARGWIKIHGEIFE